jgi:RecB family endonuclease NucS
MSEWAGTVRVGAPDTVRYTGRLTAVLPEATRLLIFKSDGSVLVHADAGGYEPLDSNMTW